jgi:hypothetical protein
VRSPVMGPITAPPSSTEASRVREYRQARNDQDRRRGENQRSDCIHRMGAGSPRRSAWAPRPRRSGGKRVLRNNALLGSRPGDRARLSLRLPSWRIGRRACLEQAIGLAVGIPQPRGEAAPSLGGRFIVRPVSGPLRGVARGGGRSACRQTDPSVSMSLPTRCVDGSVERAGDQSERSNRSRHKLRALYGRTLAFGRSRSDTRGNQVGRIWTRPIVPDLGEGTPNPPARRG